MMKGIRVFIALILASNLSWGCAKSNGSSDSVVGGKPLEGSWVGKIDMTEAEIESLLSQYDEVRKSAYRASMSTFEVPLVLSADGKFTASNQGLRFEGTWERSNDTVSLTTTSRANPAGATAPPIQVTGAKPIVLKLSADEASMTGTDQVDLMYPKVTFRRG